MKPNSIHLLVILCIVGLAIGLRISAAVAWQARLQDEQAMAFPDSHSYWYLGQRLAQGQSYEYGGPDYRVFRAPGYPLFLAVIFHYAPNPVPVVWIRVVGAVLGAVVVAGTVLLGRLLFDARTGYVAGLMAAVYPGAIGMSVFVLSEALFCPLMMGQLICWAVAWKSDSHRWRNIGAAAAGVAAGLATLTRPSWLLFTPFAIALAVLLSRHRQRHLVLGVWMMIAMSLTMSPWWIRSYHITGQFVPTTLQVGASLYDGLNPQATGASDMRFSKVFYDAQKLEDAQNPAENSGQDGIFEVRLSNRLRDAALSWAGQHPRQVVQLMGRKFVRMWNIWPNAGEFQSRRTRWIVAISYVPLLVLALVGSWKFGRRGWPFVVCLLPAVYFTVLHVFFVSSIRYRQPAILASLALAAAAIVVPRWQRGDLAESPSMSEKAAEDVRR